MPAVERVLALDLARRTGWACDGLRDDSGPPLHGVWKLPGLDPAQVDATNSILFDLVQAAIRQWRISALVVEAINQGTVSQPGLGLGHKAFPTVACLAAVRLGVKRYEVATSTWRKHFTGRGTYGSPPLAKAASVAACNRLGDGWACTDHNEAEAEGIWAYAKATMQPTWGPKLVASWSPMFAERTPGQ